MIMTACSGELEKEAAIQITLTRESVMSVRIKIVDLLDTCPRVFSSVLRCGFQWGTMSRIKWLANAKGKEITGLGILVTIAAPTKACGVSSIVKAMIYYLS